VSSLQLVQEVQKSPRRNRYPIHPAYGRAKPFELTPFMFAPVLPNETITNISHECRAITEAVKDQLIGWSLHTYFFYVKLLDLDEADAEVARDLLLDATNTPRINIENVGIGPTHPVGHFYQSNTHTKGYNWMPDVYRRIVATWFRHDSEPIGPIGALSKCHVSNLGVFDSATMASILEGVPMPTSVGDAARSLAMFEYLQTAEMIDMSYEDFCASYGGTKMTAAQMREPELLMQHSDWSYPSNVVDAAGQVRSAVSFVSKSNLSKPKYIKEPGFIMGLYCLKPKIYRGHQTANASVLLDRSTSFMPGLLADSPETSLVDIFTEEYLVADGVAPDPWFIDVRDLYMHGDQFVNVQPPYGTNTPTTVGGEIDVEYSFSPEAFWQDPLKDFMTFDNVTRLTVKSQQRDYTTARS
jgi:hypothetical protein